MKSLLPTGGKKETLTVKDRLCLINTRNGSRGDIGKKLLRKTRLILMVLNLSAGSLDCRSLVDLWGSHDGEQDQWIGETLPNGVHHGFL